MAPPRVIPKGTYNCNGLTVEHELRCYNLQEPEKMSLERLIKLRVQINEMIIERKWNVYTEERKAQINRAFFNGIAKWFKSVDWGKYGLR